MELVEVEIIAQLITARYGSLSTGDILRTDRAFAEHLINDCNGAKWPEQKVHAQPPQFAAEPPSAEVVVAPRAAEVAVEPPAAEEAAPAAESVAEVPPAIAAKAASPPTSAAKATKKSGK